LGWLFSVFSIFTGSAECDEISRKTTCEPKEKKALHTGGQNIHPERPGGNAEKRKTSCGDKTAPPSSPMSIPTIPSNALLKPFRKLIESMR